MDQKPSVVSNLATGLLVACTVVLTSIVVRREFFPPVKPQQGEQKSVRVKDVDWVRISQSGHRMGPANAKITIVEFSDFECPFCAKFSKNVISAIRRQYPNDVAFVFRHMPLPMHRFADPAARAAECAAVQGRFEEFHNSLFSKQDSLGLKSFGAFAQESGVGDLKAFEACTRRTDKNTVVQGDVAEATRSSVRATPTVIANGWWIHPAADSVRLDSLIRAELRRGNWKMTGSP